MTGLLTGVTLILWGLQLLNILAISATLLGILALITGILWLVSSVGISVPAVPVHRRAE